ncbi:MAG: 4Fe-4S dicluster domain-containing protein [bacterium]|nr:4Fe-4S dicluster domain-containing protein [bacterium]
MVKRDIIYIDETKCNGCGKCVPNCPEGALQIIDNKARLVSDLFCDGLGACIGHCPQGAITIEKRDAEPYNEKKVMKNIVKHGENTIKAHLKHLKDHNELAYLKEAKECLSDHKIKIKEDTLPCGCPGTHLRKTPEFKSIGQDSALRQWPIQLRLVPANAIFFENADLLVSSDCVPFANARFHKELLKGKALVIGCPKLDELAIGRSKPNIIEDYEEKLTEIFKNNNVKSVTVATMEVPCCYGMYTTVDAAIKKSGKNIPLKNVVTGIDGAFK